MNTNDPDLIARKNEDNELLQPSILVFIYAISVIAFLLFKIKSIFSR
jgi:hypothetical protein